MFIFIPKCEDKLKINSNFLENLRFKKHMKEMCYFHKFLLWKESKEISKDILRIDSKIESNNGFLQDFLENTPREKGYEVYILILHIFALVMFIFQKYCYIIICVIIIFLFILEQAYKECFFPDYITNKFKKIFKEKSFSNTNNYNKFLENMKKLIKIYDILIRSLLVNDEIISHYQKPKTKLN